MTRPEDDCRRAVANEEPPDPSRQAARALWNLPVVRMLYSAEAQTGANTNPDLNATFS